MSRRAQQVEKFEVSRVCKSFYSGGQMYFSQKLKKLFSLNSEKVSIISPEKSGKVEAEIEEEGDPILTFCVNHVNPRYVVTSHRSLLLRHWRVNFAELDRKRRREENVESSEEVKVELLHSWKGHDQVVMSLDFDSSGGLLASSSADKSVKVWDIPGYYCTHNFRGHQNVVSTVKFHPNKLEVASVGEDLEIKLWDLLKSSCVFTLRDHVASISDIAFSKDGEFLVSAGRDQILNFWDLSERKRLGRKDGRVAAKSSLQVPVFESLESIAFVGSREVDVDSGSSILMLSGGEKGMLRLWDLKIEEGETLPSKCVLKEKLMSSEESLSKDSERGIVKIVALSKGKAMAVTDDLKASVYQIHAAKKSDQQKTTEFLYQLMCHNDEIFGATFLKNELKNKILCLPNDETPVIFDKGTFFCSPLKGHKKTVTCSAVSQDGKFIATGGKDSAVMLWELSAGEEGALLVQRACTLEGHTASITSLVFSKSKLFSGSEDRTIKVWNLKNVDAQGKTLKSDHTWVAHDKAVLSLALSPKDKFLASGGADKMIHLWDASSHVLLGSCKGHKRGVLSLDFSPTDRVLASSGQDGSVRLWNSSVGLKNSGSPSTLECLRVFSGHALLEDKDQKMAALNVKFLRNGLQVLSSGSDGLVRLWHLKTSECVAVMDAHTDRVWGMDIDLAYSGDASAEDGGEMVTSGGDGLIVVWKDVTKEEVERRNLEISENLSKDSRIGSLLREGKHKKALSLALELRRPAQMRSVIEDAAWKALDKQEGDEEKEGEGGMDLGEWLRELIERCSEDKVTQHLETLLGYILKWQVSAKSCAVAHSLAVALLKEVKLEHLEELEGFKHFIQAFTAYGRRHQSRFQSHLSASFLVDVVLRAGNALNVAIEADQFTSKVVFGENESLSGQVEDSSEEPLKDTAKTPKKQRTEV